MLRAARTREVPLGHADVWFTRRDDGSILLRSAHPLTAYPARITERLAHWARVAPQRDFAAQRDPDGGWRRLTYGETFERVRSLAQALLDRGLSRERPLAILSENGIEHLLLTLAALHVGVPCAPVSPAYSLLSGDHGRLRAILALVTPGLVFAADGERFARAIGAAVPPDIEVVLARGDVPGRPSTRVADLERTAAGPQVESAHAGVGPDTIAKFLFTSGSTGQPKAVINTQRMLCANQQMLAQALPSLAAAPPVLVDWLPWHHTAGGNHNIGIALYNGGTLYIDEGRPLPGLIERTVRNLREVGPTIYFNVPRGYEALLPYFRADATLRRTFFSRLGLMQYAAAVLPQPVWEAYDALALETCGERILWITGYGATETAPFAMSTNRGAQRAGTVGLPVDGVAMKLVPVNDKLEARFRGPSVTPGYWRQPELTQAAFDEEGFYRTGDAMRFLDPEDPRQGMEFDGRLSEDFKLTTGTWVSVGRLRARLIAAGAPCIQDVVVTGHDRDEIGALVLANQDACKGMTPDELRARLRDVLDRLCAESTGSSNRIARVMLLDTPPSIDAGEVTDKGSVNQRAMLASRAALVEELHRDPPSARVVLPSQPEGAP